MKKTILQLFSFAALVMAMSSCSSYSLVNSDVYNNADLSQYHTFRIVNTAEGKLPPGMTMVTYYNIAAAIREQLVERGFTEDPTSPILVNIGLTVNKEVAYQAFTTPGTWVTAPPVAVAPAPAPAPNPTPNPAPDVPINGGPGLAAPPQGSGMSLTQQNAPAPQHAAPAPGPVYNGLVPYYMYPRSYYWPGNTQIVPSVYREGVLSMDIVDMNTKTPLYSSSVATILDAGDTQFRNLSGIAQAVKVLFSKFPVAMLPQYK